METPGIEPGTRCVVLRVNVHDGRIKKEHDKFFRRCTATAKAPGYEIALRQPRLLLLVPLSLFRSQLSTGNDRFGTETLSAILDYV